MASKRRTLSEDEAALWAEVVRSAKPLRPAKRVAAPKPPKPVLLEEKQSGKAGFSSSAAVIDRPASQSGAPPAKPRQPPALFDKRTARRVARGTIAIDGRLDLHGSDQATAYVRLEAFLTRARAEGWRLVLVITGKGGPGGGERGVLRRVVPHWLSSASFKPFVSGFGEAHRTHGGSGALYVRLKRQADRSF